MPDSSHSIIFTDLMENKFLICCIESVVAILDVHGRGIIVIRLQCGPLHSKALADVLVDHTLVNYSHIIDFELIKSSLVQCYFKFLFD